MKTLVASLVLTFAFCLSNLLLSSSVFADTSPGGLISNVGQSLNAQGNPFKYTEVGVLVSRSLSLGLIAASLLVVIYFVWGGIQWIISSGDKNSLESAKGKITNAVFGLTMVAASWALFLIVRTFLGLPVTITGGGSGSGGSGGGGTTPYTCDRYPCDCCNLAGNDKSVKCCHQIGNLTSCVVGRFKNNTNQCSSDFRIDWNCWSQNYDNLVRSGKLNPSTDACK